MQPTIMMIGWTQTKWTRKADHSMKLASFETSVMRWPFGWRTRDLPEKRSDLREMLAISDVRITGGRER